MLPLAIVESQIYSTNRAQVRFFRRSGASWIRGAGRWAILEEADSKPFFASIAIVRERNGMHFSSTQSLMEGENIILGLEGVSCVPRWASSSVQSRHFWCA